MRVFLDAGHGGYDPGAVGKMSLREADVTLAVALLVRDKLAALGHVVLMSRVINQYVSLQDRALLSNSNDADIFISIHCNAAANREASGIEAWTTKGRTKSDEWADALLVALHKAFPHESLRRDYTDGDGDKEGSLYVLQHTSAPAVLLELGFISHPETELQMRLPSWRERCAEAIASVVGRA